MSNDIDDDDSGQGLDHIDLDYSVYTDDPNLTVYLKFTGFSQKEQLAEFAEYIDSYVTLIFANDTKH